MVQITSRFIILISAILSLTSIGAKASVCEQALDKGGIGPVHVFTYKILNDADKRKIKTILEGPASNKLEAFREAYIRARIRTFNPQDREKIRMLLQQHPQVEFFQEDNGKHILNAGHIKMWEGFKNTILPYQILAHEIEHTVQLYQFFGMHGKGLTLKQNIRGLATQLFGVVTKYKTEKGAMQAEWEIMNLASPELLKHTKQVIDSAKYNYKYRDFKESYHRYTNNASLTRDQYIQAEHANGRYSVGDICIASGLRWTLVITLIYNLFL